MLDEKTVNTVQVENEYIYFTSGTDADTTFFKTAAFNDAELVDRFYASCCEIGQVVQKHVSPLMLLLLTWILPIALFALVGQFMTKKLMDKNGLGGLIELPSMQFGKSGAKVYVASTTSIKFADVVSSGAGEKGAREQIW